MAVWRLAEDSSRSEGVDKASVNPPLPSCVGKRIIEVGRPCNCGRRLARKGSGWEYTCSAQVSKSATAECRGLDRGLDTVSEKTFSFVARASSVMIHDESREWILCRGSSRRPVC